MVAFAILRFAPGILSSADSERVLGTGSGRGCAGAEALGGAGGEALGDADGSAAGGANTEALGGADGSAAGGAELTVALDSTGAAEAPQPSTPTTQMPINIRIQDLPDNPTGSILQKDNP